jgi:hypothetical protein
MRQTSLVHIDEEQAEQYSFGKLSDPELARAEEHLLICEECRTLVQRQDAFVAAMQAGAVRLRAEKSLFPHNVSWLRLAAVAAALVMIAVFVQTLAKRKPAVFAIALTATRGAAAEVKAPAGVPLALQPDLTGLPPFNSYRLEMVDQSGRNVWKGTFPGLPATAETAGIYFVRISSPAGELLREYALVLTK